MAAADRPIRLLHCTGSPVDERWADLSRLYAGQALEAMIAADEAGRWEHVIVDVSPDGTWRFPDSLGDLGAARPLDRSTALSRLATLPVDVGVPQMFCRPGLTDHRSLLSLLGIPSVGNTAEVMAITADKAITRAVVSAAGVRVPRATLLRRGDPLPDLTGPVVVKPVDADNSDGVHLVDASTALTQAVDDALGRSTCALVEDFVPLGREVRCGTVRRDGRLIALPLEEYDVDPVSKPIRRADDKLERTDDGDLRLVAKDVEHAWIVPDDDPIVDAVQRLARTAHEALGCRHHGLVDLRIDPDGRPWFLEAGPYCSFAPSSVVVTMADAAGYPLEQLFSDAVDLALHDRAVRRPAVAAR